MEAIYPILIGLYIIAFIVASRLPMKKERITQTEDYTYVKPKIINEYTDDDIQEKKRIFEECLQKGMTPFDALLHCK